MPDPRNSADKQGNAHAHLSFICPVIDQRNDVHRCVTLTGERPQRAGQQGFIDVGIRQKQEESAK